MKFKFLLLSIILTFPISAFSPNLDIPVVMAQTDDDLKDSSLNNEIETKVVRQLQEIVKHALAETSELTELFDNHLNTPLMNLFGTGVNFVREKEYEQAIISFSEAINLTQTINLTEAVNINPNAEKLLHIFKYNTYINRGQTYYSIGEYEKAMIDFSEAINLVKTFNSNYIPEKILQLRKSTSYINRARCYVSLSQYEKAIADYDQAIKISVDSHYPSIYINEIYLSRGVAFHLLGNQQKALEDYHKQINIAPNFPTAYINIGLIEYEKNNLNKAIEKWQKAISVSQENPEAILALAVALFQQGKEEQAFTLAEQALELNKNYANLEYLKENLWGNKLLADTEKLLNHSKIKKILSQDK